MFLCTLNFQEAPTSDYFKIFRVFVSRTLKYMDPKKVGAIRGSWLTP